VLGRDPSVQERSGSIAEESRWSYGQTETPCILGGCAPRSEHRKTCPGECFRRDPHPLLATPMVAVPFGDDWFIATTRPRHVGTACLSRRGSRQWSRTVGDQDRPRLATPRHRRPSLARFDKVVQVCETGNAFAAWRRTATAEVFTREWDQHNGRMFNRWADVATIIGMSTRIAAIRQLTADSTTSRPCCNEPSTKSAAHNTHSTATRTLTVTHISAHRTGDLCAVSECREVATSCTKGAQDLRLLGTTAAHCRDCTDWSRRPQHTRRTPGHHRHTN
jgi:hypothetical protein